MWTIFHSAKDKLVLYQSCVLFYSLPPTRFVDIGESSIPCLENQSHESFVFFPYSFYKNIQVLIKNVTHCHYKKIFNSYWAPVKTKAASFCITTTTLRVLKRINVKQLIWELINSNDIHSSESLSTSKKHGHCSCCMLEFCPGHSCVSFLLLFSCQVSSDSLWPHWL